MDKIGVCPKGHKHVIESKDAHKPFQYCPECDAANARADLDTLQPVSGLVEALEEIKGLSSKTGVTVVDALLKASTLAAEALALYSEGDQTLEEYGVLSAPSKHLVDVNVDINWEDYTKLFDEGEQWSDTAPSVPGWYWFKGSYADEDGGDIKYEVATQIVIRGGELQRHINPDIYTPVKYCGGQWYGPIHPPKGGE